MTQPILALLALLILVVGWAALEVHSLRKQLQPVLESGVARAISSL